MPEVSINNQLFIAIMSCKKNANPRNAIRRTWLRDCSYPYKFFIGGERSKDALDDEVYLDCPDTYEGQEIKTIQMVFYAKKNKFLNMFKCDDDSYLNCKLLPRVLEKKYDYAGRPVNNFDRTFFFPKVPVAIRKPLEDMFDIPFASGQGYFLSEKSMDAILNNAPLKWDGVMKLEDEFVGDQLYRSGIKVKEINNVLLNDKEQIFGKKRFLLDKYLVIHHCTVGDMYDLFNKKIIKIHLKYFLTNFLALFIWQVGAQIKKPHVPIKISKLFLRKNANG